MIYEKVDYRMFGNKFTVSTVHPVVIVLKIEFCLDKNNYNN